MEKMTLQQIEQLPGEYLLPKHVAAVLDCEPYSINCAAQDDPDRLGFPVIITGNRVRIPKAGFLYFMKYGKPPLQPPDIWIDRAREAVLDRLKERGEIA